MLDRAAAAGDANNEPGDEPGDDAPAHDSSGATDATLLQVCVLTLFLLSCVELMLKPTSLRAAAPTGVSAWQIVVHTVPMSLAAGLSVIPCWLMRGRIQRWAAASQAVATGIMISVSMDLIGEAVHTSLVRAALGIGGGLLFVQWAARVISKYDSLTMAGTATRGSDARRIALLTAIMTLHSVGEGCGVGVSFLSQSPSQGLFVVIMIAVHNIPEGVIVAMPMLAAGESLLSALVWSVLSASPQPAVALVAFYCASAFVPLLPVALGFAAGCMLWVAFAEVYPESLQHVSAHRSGALVVVSIMFVHVLRSAVTAAAAISSSSRRTR